MSNLPVVFITGSSQGIGAASAREFARQGYRCALVDIQEESLNRVAEELRQTGTEVLTCVGDLYDIDFAHHAVKQCLHEWGQIDVLLNNAAWRDIVTMRKIELESWERTLRVCLTTPAFLARWCAESMERAGGGVILNVSSIQSRFPAGISPAYVAAKGGMDALTHELAILYGPVGIRVLSVNLGAIDTELSKGYGSSGIDLQLRNYVEDMIPLGRYGQSDEIAKTLTMLVSDAATYLTGTTIEIDGGWYHQSSPYSLKAQQFPGEFSATKATRQ